MREAFETAKLNTAESSLYVAACDSLRKASRNPAMAVDSFTATVMADPELLCELGKTMTRAMVMQVAMNYLRHRANEMAGGASQPLIESRVTNDRPSDQHNDDRACQTELESQTAHDRPASRDADLRSHFATESQSDCDPQVRAKGKAHKTKIGSAGAIAAASNSIFARRISYDLVIGAATYEDFRTLAIKGHVMEHFGSRMMAELSWSENPDIRARQRVPDVADEAQVKLIHDGAYSSFAALRDAHAAK